MIQDDFKDFFLEASASSHQKVISELLSISVEKVSLDDRRQVSVVSCPYCGHHKIRTNGKLKGVQWYFYKGYKYEL